MTTSVAQYCHRECAHSTFLRVAQDEKRNHASHMGSDSQDGHHADRNEKWDHENGHRGARVSRDLVRLVVHGCRR